MNQRIQRKRTAGWRMPPNTNKIISKERQTYTLCHGHKDEKRNTIASHAEDMHTESHYSIAPNKNISNIIGQDAIGTMPTDGKEELKRENKEQHTEMKNLKQEKQEQNETMQSSESTCLKDLENNVYNAASRIKERSKSPISMAAAIKNANNLDGNISKCSRVSQTKNSKANIEHSAPIAIKSNAIPVRVQRKRTKGFNLQKTSPNGLPVVYAGRPTRWGNPYTMADGLERQTCIEFYEAWLRKQLTDDPHFLDPLKGKDLACWCPLDKACHVDVILQILNEQEVRDALSKSKEIE